jgi:type II secretory pathway pseudopilin PulG
MKKPLKYRPATLQSGFTYVGLLFFLFVIALSSLVVVQTASLVARRAAEQELLFIGREFSLAFRTYYLNTPAGQRRYPNSLQDLLRDARTPEVSRHLRRLYADPLTGKSTWGLVEAPEGGILGVHSLSQEKPIKIGNFDVDQTGFRNAESYADWIFYYSPTVVEFRRNLTHLAQ